MNTLTHAMQTALQASDPELLDIVIRVADNLGISVDQLKAAELAVAKQHLDKAVADGKLTQQQADEIYSKLQSGDIGAFGFGQGFGGPGRGPGHGMKPGAPGTPGAPGGDGSGNGSGSGNGGSGGTTPGTQPQGSSAPNTPRPTVSA